MSESDICSTTKVEMITTTHSASPAARTATTSTSTTPTDVRVHDRTLSTLESTIRSRFWTSVETMIRPATATIWGQTSRVASVGIVRVVTSTTASIWVISDVGRAFVTLNLAPSTKNSLKYFRDAKRRLIDA